MKLLTINVSTIFSLLILLALFPFYSFANIGYISLHEIESAPEHELSLKLNIVEEGQPLPFKFILQSHKKRIALSYQRLNNYMLRLKSPSPLVGKAAVHVYQLEQDAWRLIKRIKISNDLSSISSVSKTANTNKILNSNFVENIANVQANKKTNCTLTKQSKETLWGIASRYKSQWNVDIYSAMIAIYKSNLTHFSQQHIGQLIDQTTLICPSSELINSMGTKVEMKAEFTRLNKK